jgi:hypothetical protein
MRKSPSVTWDFKPGVYSPSVPPTMLSSKLTCPNSKAPSLSNDDLVASMEEKCKSLASKMGCCLSSSCYIIFPLHIGETSLGLPDPYTKT